MKIDHLIFLLIATVSLVFVAFILTGCKSEDWKALDQIQGHDALGQTVINTPISLPPEALVASSASSAQPSIEPPPVVASSSSSAYVPSPEPPKEPCEPGSKGYRLWDCVDGFRSYW